MGFIRVKLSGSLVRNGFLLMMIVIIITIVIIMVLSFIRNEGLRVIVSFILVPIGFDDSFSCRYFMWIRIIIVIIRGVMKWRARARFRVM